MKFLKAIKKTSLIVGATYIAIGVQMVMNKKAGTNLLFEILSYGLLAAGILSMIRYFLLDVTERIKRSDFVVGLLLLTIASIIYLTKKDISYLVDKFVAIAIIISGFNKIQDMFDTSAAGKKAYGAYIFGFLFCISMGALILFEVVKNNDILFVISGILMCVCGISDIISDFYVAYAVSNIGNKEEIEIKDVVGTVDDVKEEEPIEEDPEKPLE